MLNNSLFGNMLAGNSAIRANEGEIEEVKHFNHMLIN